ncbi:MAG: PD40 domain-containing protein [Candidatus Eremiobacteraeota bacterium]|nr:PD40 domain-containing protein [Candidatus Eremiobacteraeota bacterium]
MHITSRRRSRGLSLIELVAVFAILAILLGLTAISLKSSVQREGPKAMAHNLVADLRAARTEASRSGKLVAVCFPSEEKTNPFSQNALVRRGAQVGDALRTLSYDRAYNGYIFAGTWPGATPSGSEVPVGWTVATENEISIYFRPDGTAFSNDLPSVEGNYPLVVGSAFVADRAGPASTVTAVSDPYTVWISGSGNISLDEGTTPAGSLPPTDIKPHPAPFGAAADSKDSSPVIEDIKFLPEGIPGSDTVGLSQNYVDIHPDQKESERLEYGIATMLITASDRDGGPLYFDLYAIASSGERGKFTVSNETGAMDYIYDPTTDAGKWQALVSWRPPPGAPEDTVYELQITIRDEEGHSAFTASGAGLLPKIANLPPSRMVIQTADRQLYMANIEGANTVKLTKDEEPEYEPFFSPDGTRIYSKHDTPAGGLQLRVRNADGSDLRVLREFSPAIVAANRAIDGDIDIRFDPTYHYAAYRFNIRNADYEAYRVVTQTKPLVYRLVPDHGRPGQIYELELLHHNGGVPPLKVATDAYGQFYWDGETDHTLRFKSRTSYEELDYRVMTGLPPNSGLGPYLPVPGYRENPTDGVTLEGFPPTTRPAMGVGVNATNQIFNLTEPDWFLETPSPGIQLRRTSMTSSNEVTDDSIVGKPAWSADGLFVAYVKDNGTDQEITVKEVLNPDFSAKSSPVVKYTYRTSGVSSVKLSPKGRWVFFIKGNKLYRAINSSGSTPVEISSSLGKDIAAFAVSQ